MRVLVAFASRHGSTKGIAERVAATLREKGHDAEAKPLAAVGSLDGYGAVVVGSAIYYGAWMREGAEFVRRNAEALATRMVWLFDSGPTGNVPAPEARDVADLTERVHPLGHRTFAGAIDVGALSFVERMVVARVKAPEGDFRDWTAIDAWASEIASALAGAPVPA